MAEYQITYWRDLPSLVVAREGDVQAKTQLAPRFQEAIDEAAMRLGDVSSGDYLDGWRRDDWAPGDGAPRSSPRRSWRGSRSSGRPRRSRRSWTASAERGLTRSYLTVSLTSSS